MESTEQHTKAGRDVVVLLYGLAGVRALLRPLARALRRDGFATESWAYPSWLHDLDVHVGKFCAHLAQLDQDPTIGKIHCVGHSMGAIIVRAALVRNKPKKLGRVVFLAPPHKGSRVATALAPRLGKILRFLPQLSTAPDSFVNQLGELAGVEFGVVAASHDHIVGPGATELAGQKDHVELRSLHTVILHPDVGPLVASFLKDGRFRRD